MPPVFRPPTPTRFRWWILVLLFLSLIINVLDRQVLSLVAPVLRDELKLSSTAYGVIVFAFLLGMTLGQIPAGMVMDRKGARFGFTFILVWWSSANVLHAFARSVMQFSVLRFLLGAGESGNFSGGVKVIGEWFPPRERALAGGIFTSGSLVGAMLAPPLIVFIVVRFGWPAAFVLPTLLGLLWLIPWRRIYWEPWRHPGIAREDAVKLEPHGAPKLTIFSLLAVPAVWGVILMRCFGGPVTHFYWYWLPEYLKHERGMPIEMIGLFAWLPFFSGALGNIGGGWMSSWFLERGWGLDRSRKAPFLISAAVCVMAVLVPAAPNAGSALTIISLASLGINAFTANLIGLLTDLFPQPVLARVSSLTGVGDGIMSMLMMLATGVVVDRFSYLPVFIAAGLLPVIAVAALYVFIGNVRPISLPERAVGPDGMRAAAVPTA